MDFFLWLMQLFFLAILIIFMTTGFKHLCYKGTDDFVFALIVAVFLFFLTPIPYTFLPWQMGENKPLSHIVVETDEMYGVVVDKKMFTVDNYSNVATLKRENYQVYKQEWIGTASFIPRRTVYRVFNHSGNHLGDLNKL